MKEKKLSSSLRLLTAIAVLGGLALSRFKSQDDTQTAQIPEGARFLLPLHNSWDITSYYSDICPHEPEIDVLRLDLSGGYPDGSLRAEVFHQGNFVPTLVPATCTFDSQYDVRTGVGAFGLSGRPPATVELLSSSTGESGIVGNPATVITRGPAGQTAVITATFGIQNAFDVWSASNNATQQRLWIQKALINVAPIAQPGQVELDINVEGRALIPFAIGLMTVYTDTTGVARTEISSLNIDTITGIYPNVANSKQHWPLTLQFPPGRVQYQVTAKLPPEVTLITDGTQIGEVNAAYLLYLPLLSK